MPEQIKFSPVHWIPRESLAARQEASRPAHSFARGFVVFATARYVRFVAHFLLLQPLLSSSLLVSLNSSVSVARYTSRGKSRYSLYIFRVLVKLFYLPYLRSHAHPYFPFIPTCN